MSCICDNGAVNLINHGLYGDGRNESVAFRDAMDLAVSLGVNKITSPSNRTFRLTDVKIPASMEIDLCGSTIIGDFNNAITGGSTNALHNLPTGADVSNFGLRTGKVWTGVYVTPESFEIIIRNTILDGDYDEGVNPFDDVGQVMLLLYGGNVTLDKVILQKYATRAGKGDAKVFMDYRNQGILIQDADRVTIKDVKTITSTGEDLVIQSRDQRTVLNLNGFYGDKTTHFDNAVHTNTPLNLYNLNEASLIQNVRIGRTRKSGCNFMTSGTFRGLYGEECSESSMFDFNEARTSGYGKIDVSGFKVDYAKVSAVRATGSNIRIANGHVKDCTYAIWLEGATNNPMNPNGADPAEPALFPELPTQDVEMFNVDVEHISSDGHDAQNLGVNALIRAEGASSAKPIHLTVKGGSAGGNNEWPHTKTEYGIWCDNVELKLEGSLKEGRSALVYMQGYANFKAVDAHFIPEPGQSLNVIQFNDADIQNIVLRDTSRLTPLDGGYKDIVFTGATTLDGSIYLDRSQTINELSDVSTFRILENGVITKREEITATTLTSHSRWEFTTQVYGAKVGDVVNIIVEDEDTIVFAQGHVSSVDTVYGNLLNFTSSDLSGNDYNILVEVSPEGYDRS